MSEQAINPVQISHHSNVMFKFPSLGMMHSQMPGAGRDVEVSN